MKKILFAIALLLACLPCLASNVNTSYVVNGSDALVSGLSFKRAYLYNEASGTTVHERVGLASGLDMTGNLNGGSLTWSTSDPSFATCLQYTPAGTSGASHGATTTAATGADIQSETYTIAIAMKTSTTPTSYCFVASNYTTGGIQTFDLLIDGGGLGIGTGYGVAETYDGTNIVRANTGVSICDGNPHQIVLRRVAQSVLQIFVDGVLKGSSTDTTAAGASVSTGQLCVGDVQTVLGESYSGKISYLYYWSSALSYGGVSVGSTATGQIADLYANPLRMWQGASYGQYYP